MVVWIVNGATIKGSETGTSFRQALYAIERRDECIYEIRKENLPLPLKSSCFFCPNMRPHEIMELNALYPHLAERALKIESNAELTTIKGLGRRFAWSDLLHKHQCLMICMNLLCHVVVMMEIEL